LLPLVLLYIPLRGPAITALSASLGPVTARSSRPAVWTPSEAMSAEAIVPSRMSGL
jgi:hypothetical protein